MTFYIYRCPLCGLEVKLDHQSVQLVEIKVCSCGEPPEERTEEVE